MTHDEIQQLAALDAIGAATPDETAELHGHLTTCADCRAAAEALNETAAMIALSAEPVTPPRGVRDALLRKLNAAEGGGAPRRLEWWLATAAAILLVLWGVSAVRLRNALESERVLRRQVAELASDRAKLSETVSALTQSKTRTIELAGQSIAPTASARVFLDPTNRRAFVFFHELPANTSGKSYQLWIIRADQVAPQSAGVFSVDAAGSASLVVQNLPVDTTIKALAVTLEAKGGAAAPTGEKYLAGTSG